jgi:hypothetical protein
MNIFPRGLTARSMMWCKEVGPARSAPSARASVRLVFLATSLLAISLQARAAPSPRPAADEAGHLATFEGAQRFFYNGDYDGAAAATQALCTVRPDDLAACELRTTSLLFQIKKALRDTAALDKSTAWERCATCPSLLAAFQEETTRSQAFARARLKSRADDEAALFFLGKVDLNYVWLQLGIFGHKTGWDEYWEARKSLDRVLRMHPEHARARVARAWVDYIVGTTVPTGVRWLLGGGNKKRGLRVVRDVAAQSDADVFVRAEATFALWDMQVRERDLPAAVATARTLALDFPANAELQRLLTEHASTMP